VFFFNRHLFSTIDARLQATIALAVRVLAIINVCFIEFIYLFAREYINGG
jgi:hypothetical protein